MAADLVNWIGWLLSAALGLWLLVRLVAYLRLQIPRQQALVIKIDRVLPQTQCGKCGYPGCRPYAEAIAAGAAINRCPPGGHRTIVALARLLNEQPRPLDPAHGDIEPSQVAFIREDECIGCMKCIRACPVDAILGSGKLMHTVIASECTGCDLCVEPCPVDCIDIIPDLDPAQVSLPHRRVDNPLDELEAQP